MMTIDPALQQIIEGQQHDPFSVLGLHDINGRQEVRAFLPEAESVHIGPGNIPMQRIEGTDLFSADVTGHNLPGHYQLSWIDKDGKPGQHYDPYSFQPILEDFDLYLFAQGKHWHVYNILGSHIKTIDNISGTCFAVWAPNAMRVSVVGDFNQWDGRCHPMRFRNSGVWEIFIPGLDAGTIYKYEVMNRDSKDVHLKTDPYAQQYQIPPDTASIISEKSQFKWTDISWIKYKQDMDWQHQPMTVYEVHLGSWRKTEKDQYLTYRELADDLVSYVKDMGYTHIELLPITEHPYAPSWGYQATGFFAPTSRFGDPDDFRYFVNRCHEADIGIILDWVPAHFPKDAFALARFDGTALYEHEDPRQGEHRDWGTYIFNYDRNEVKNFLLASAVFWLEEFHIDGLRVDAVASMLYLDYSREEHDWIPNEYGGNENLAAISFLREMNHVTQSEIPGSLIIAEESTAWPGVTLPPDADGLGFTMKWNMGWMHDTLQYMQKEPIHRSHHHNSLSFGLLYAFTENFVLPFSHDEVVHGKGSMITKMPGDDWQKFANLRMLYTFMFTYPGKKLLFMGCDFAQRDEWNQKHSLDWHLLQYAPHQGISELVTDLNQLYKSAAALHYHDFEPEGFEWISCDDSSQSVLTFMRKCKEDKIVVILNFTPVPRENYRIGLHDAGVYEEILNSDSSIYGGNNVGNHGYKETEDYPWMDREYSLNLTLPPLAGIVLKLTDQTSPSKQTNVVTG
ncbi:MAG: 1,4-alpha-glucan branching protein GlgB [Gammaproteobacteria bacterium]|nr:1,4-alpha-glucan branching protein GlgB [Gammaproteobacteria bacterium]